MPLYVCPLVLSMMVMVVEKWLWPSAGLVGVWVVLLVAGGLMMAFQGLRLRINRAALRHPTAPLFELGEVVDTPQHARHRRNIG